MHPFEGREHLLYFCSASRIYRVLATLPQERENPISQASRIAMHPWWLAASSGGRKSTELLEQLGPDVNLGLVYAFREQLGPDVNLGLVYAFRGPSVWRRHALRCSNCSATRMR